MARTLINGAEQIQSGSIPWSAMQAMSAALSMNSYQINNVANGVAANDAVNVSQLNAVQTGFQVRFIQTVSVSNVSSLSGLPTVDGVTMVSGKVTLLTGQTTQSQNGPWTVASGSWTRPTWWASASTIPEGQYFIADPDGTTYKNSKWFCTNTSSITVDTTAETFQQDLSGTSYTNGTGLNLSGNVFSANFGTTSGTIAQGNDSRITGALQTSSLGTSVQTALGVGVGTAGAFVVNGGALGTPSSGTLSNCNNLPASSGLTGILAAANFPALTGDVTTASGSLATTVNNAAGSGFTKYTNFVVGEAVGGTINGSNTAFTIANTPATCKGGASSVQLFYAGELLKGGGADYSISGTSITMSWAPANSANGNFTANYMV